MGPQYEGAKPLPTQHLTQTGNSPALSNGINLAALNDPTIPLELLSQLTELSALNSTLNAMKQQERPLKLDRSVSCFEPSPVTSPPNSPNKNPISTSSHHGQRNVVNPSRYKTEVCRPYNENGFCKYGDKCQFAHGDHEIRGLPRHPKYKTELCRTFHTIGFCPYGPRCHFIHSEDESKLVEISHMKQQQAAEQAAKEMAQLQLQHQAIQSQLKTLVSRFNHPRVVKQLEGVPTTLNMKSPSTCDNGHTKYTRPQLLHSISVHPLMRDNLGSAGDTPPDSASGSPPVLSPVFTDDSVSDVLSESLSSVTGFKTPPASINSSAFNFSPSLSSSMSSSASSSSGDASPLTMSPVKPAPPPGLSGPSNQTQLDSLIRSMAAQVATPSLSQQLSATLQNMSLGNGKSNRHHDDQLVLSPSSSPDFDANGRLPVFSRLASQN